ncbi:tumor suppressor protein mn1 [Branchiostoma belcheri]|nr:tumor suppressor protein mn1 [Branchiostoma belcheri]
MRCEEQVNRAGRRQWLRSGSGSVFASSCAFSCAAGLKQRDQTMGRPTKPSNPPDLHLSRPPGKRSLTAPGDTCKFAGGSFSSHGRPRRWNADLCSTTRSSSAKTTEASVGENGTGGYANGASGWWGREGGGYMNVVAHHPQHAYHHEQGFDPQTCINLKGFEFSDLDHALLGEDPAMRSHAARLHQLGAQSQQHGHAHAAQGFHQDVSYHAQTGGIAHGDPTGKFPGYQRSEYHAQQQIQGGERHQLYSNGANYAQFAGMHQNVALKHHPRNTVYQGMVDMPQSVPGQFVRTQENEASARTQPTDHWQQHRNFPNQGMPSHPVHAQVQNSAAVDSFEKIAQTELRMRMLYAQQSSAAAQQQRSMLSPVQANTPSPALQKQCAAGSWQPAPLVSRSSSISSTHSNLSGTSGQCFSPCMQTPTPIPQSPCGPVPQSPCQAQHPPHRSPNLSSLRAVQDEGARWSCEQPTQVMQTVPQQGPAEPANPLLDRQTWELQQRTGAVVEREQCTAWSPNFPASVDQQHSVLPNHLQGEENVFSSQDSLQVGYDPSLPKVEREVDIPRLQMASPPVPYQIDMSRLEAKDQNFQRQIQIVQNTPVVEGRGYPYQQEQPVPESPSFPSRHGDQFYPSYNTQSGLSIPAASVSNAEGPKEGLSHDLVVPPSQEQRLSHPAMPMVVEHDNSVDSKAAPNFMWPSDGMSKSEQVLSNSSQVPTSIVNNYREAVPDLPTEATRPRTQNVLAALSTACHNLITDLQRSTYHLYETVGKEDTTQGVLEHGGMAWDSNEQVSQEMWKAEVDEVPGLPSVGSNDEDGMKQTTDTATGHSLIDTTVGLNPATLQNTDTSLHLTIVNGNVYPASGPNLQPNPVGETPQVTEVPEETAESSKAKANLPCEEEGLVTQVSPPLYTQQRSSETCQSESGFESKCVVSYSQDDQSIQQLENPAFVKTDQEDRSGGTDSRQVAGEDRHPLEILQAQIRLQQQQFNLAPTETTLSRPSSAPCTTDSKEALLEDTWYQPSSPGPDDSNRAPWEKNRDKIIKIEELEPGSVDRRLLHKLNEQRRRDSLKSAIYCLKQAIPDCRDSSDQSQQNVLNKANNFILEMLDKQRQADQCREEVRNLRARNLALQQGISALQREYSHLSSLELT